MITKSGRNLVLNQNRIYTLQDKISEQPISLFGSDIVNSKRGNLRQIHPGRCYDFLGTNEYVDCGDDDDFSFDGTTDRSFSISAWIYMDDATQFKIITKDDGSSNREWQLCTDTQDKLVLYLITSSGNHIGRKYDTVVTSYQGEWIHIAGTYSGSETVAGIKIYLDGIRIDSVDDSAGTYTGMTNTSQPVYIGKVIADYANGKMHDVRIHSKELSKKEIWEIMKGRPSGYELGWWKMEEGGGDISFDSSGRGHHGEIKNAVLSTFHVNSPILSYSFLNNGGYSGGRYYPGTTYIYSPEDSCIDLNPGIIDYTIDGWFYYDGSGNGYILAKGGQNPAIPGYWIYVGSGLLSISHTTGTTGHYLQRPAVMSSGWHYFAMVVDRDYAIQLYEDLLDVCTLTLDEQADIQPVNNFNIGTNPSSSGVHDGYIGTIRYTARALTLSEVRDAYNNGFTEDDDTKMIAQFDSYGNYIDIVGDRPFFYETTVPVYIPRNESNTIKDISGEILKYSGEVKYNTAVSSMCADFNGSTDYINCNDKDEFSFVGDLPFSVSAWVNVDNFSTYRSFVSKDGVSSGMREWSLNAYLSGNYIRFTLFKSDGTAVIGRVGPTCPIGKWVHFVGTYDGSKSVDGIKIYMDSIRVDNTDNISGAYDGMSNTNQPVLIGRFGSYEMDGKICDARIFNKELSKSEIELVMSGERNGSEVAWYPLADGNGEVVHDVSGNDLHGTVAGATLSTFWGQTQDKFHYNNRRGFSDGLYFNGTTAYGSCSSSAVFQPGTNPFSIEAVICLSDYSDGIQTIYSNLVSSTDRIWFYITAAGILTLVANDTSTVIDADTDANPFTDRRIHHVAVAVDPGNSIVFYVDGSVIASTTTTNTGLSLTPNQTLYIGSYNTSTQLLDGIIYGVRYSNKTRTSDEIFYSYKYGMTSDEHAVALWDFKNGLGINVTDENDNNLTLTNTEQVRIPALSTNLTRDVLGHPLQHTGDGLNGSGDIIDFTGGVASPRLNDHRLGYVNLNGTNDYIDCGDHDDLSFGDGTDDSPFSVSAWINMDDATNFMITGKDDGSSNREWQFYVSASDLLRFIVIDSPAYEGRQSSALTTYQGQWIYVAATYDGSGGVDAADGIALYVNGIVVDNADYVGGAYAVMANTSQPVYLGRNNVFYANGYIRDVKIYGNELTADQVKEDYKTGGVSGVRLIRNFKLSKDAYDSSINKEHGSVKGTNINFPKATVDTSYEQGDYSPHPFYKKDFGSVIECVTAGRLFSLFNQVYGIWEFDWYKDLDASMVEFEFMSDMKTSGNGYGIKFSGSEAVVLEKNVSGTPSTLMSTAVSYLDIDTWYSIKVVRNSAENEYVNGVVGIFGVYVDGVLATASTGTNPVTDNTYTTSGFMVFNIDAGDKIRNLKFNNELINVSKFQVDSGSYKVSGDKENNFVLLERPLIQQASSRPVFRYTKTVE